MPPTVLYCADPLHDRRADGHFAAEAREVRAQGGTRALVDHDALLRGDAQRAVAHVPEGSGPCWYRGWMIPVDRYRDLARELARRGAPLIVTPDRYRAAHELPGWYREFAELTPAGAWTEEGALGVDVAALARRLPPGPGIVKDYVKSRKHEWDEACYVPDLHDPAELARVVGRFTELQGEWLAGGIVLRAFELYEKPVSAATELRVWWLDGAPRLVTAHPDGPAAHDPDPVPAPELARIADAVARLGCRFVTTDLARRTDGVWRVVEVGDGQVSDAHPATDPGLLPSLLLGARP
ncbi:ATP-grasp domain-containing protein [Streptomyces solicathayae]|uniref:ATP-grasp domain-containing protein n=1 Tax=Streptomyces solicathayae TaxID=3081768 RepID=A0ABZ0M5A2_9ACTN|nr:ATP-grasp domain-containing protein [Streptomyces sp. HUAS YS2]WOX26263.1 ATP-grasp domain-containing protein [Streptomyces sp. HUAS YS2]